jgi:anion-transporting  ArsA/GET3 family ATPase
MGRRVLLAEFEEPSDFHRSPLATCFGTPRFPRSPRHLALDGEPLPKVKEGPGIWGVTLQSETGTELFLTSLFKVPALARLALRTPALRRLLHAGPSFHEMGLFYHLLHELRACGPDGVPLYDLVVIDMPATGHTLALTGLPAILLRLVARGPIADALRAGQAILNDPLQTAACVVTLPEPLPVSECVELLDGLRLTSMPVGVVIANRVPQDPFSAEEHAALDEILTGIQPRGLTLLDRIRRAGTSLETLRGLVDAPLFLVREVAGDDPFRAVSAQLVEEAP